MLKKWANSRLKRSEQEIQNFLGTFEIASDIEKASVVAAAAFVHYEISSADISFSKLINSNIGENQGPISSYILELNSLSKRYQEANNQDGFLGVSFWNISFRCMSNNSLHHYGLRLWKEASKNFDSAKKMIEDQIETVKMEGDKTGVDMLNAVMTLTHFIPPQFRTNPEN